MKQIYCHTWLEPQMCNQFYMESLILYYEVQYLSMNIDRCDTLFTDNDMFDHVCAWKSMINIICSFDLFHIDYVLIVICLYLSFQMPMLFILLHIELLFKYNVFNCLANQRSFIFRVSYSIWILYNISDKSC